MTDDLHAPDDAATARPRPAPDADERVTVTLVVPRWILDLRRGIRSTQALVRRLRPVALDAAQQGAVARVLLVAAVLIGTTGALGAASVHTTGSASVATLARVAIPRLEPAGRAQPGRFADTAAAVENPIAEVPTSMAPIPPAPAGATVPQLRGTLPVGKGMWIWMPERAEGGDPNAIVARAKAVGLTHLYVRTGSSRSGLQVAFLDAILPVAHANGIRVYGWDFPYFENVDADVARATAAITHLTPGGHRIDGFVADIETSNEGVNMHAVHAAQYGDKLRRTVGDRYPLIACVPRPNPLLNRYPMAEVVAAFDAIAPMVYWMNRDPGADVAGAIEHLAIRFNKPIIPVGQAYDGAPEGGPPGVPRREQLIRFMQVADSMGAVGVSFWSWQHADQQAWDAIRDAGEFTLPAAPQNQLTPGQVRAYQTLVGWLGFPGPGLPRTGVWDAATVAAVTAYQQAAGLPVTGGIDARTRAALLTPFSPPLPPPR